MNDVTIELKETNEVLAKELENLTQQNKRLEAEVGELEACTDK